MIAIGYVRRSKKSDGKTISLEDQEQRIREYCAANGLTCAEVVRHDGVSGAKRKRFDEIEQAVSHVSAGCIVVYHLDRLARDNAGLQDYLASLAKRGIRLFESAGVGEIKTKRAIDKLQNGLRGTIDEYYREIIREKTSDALQHLKASGRRYTHIAPFGFTWADNKLAPEPEEQRALRIIAECAELGLSVRHTQTTVRSQGYTGRLGRMTVHKYLTSPPPTIKDSLPAAYFALPG